MEKIVDDIINALENVSGKYIIPSNGKPYLAERIFAYEFYHQYRLLMIKNKDMYKDHYLCGEQSKIFANNTQKDKSTACPDIVLAGDIENIDPTTQYWVAEIKMYGNNQWESDIPKLTQYAKSVLSFQKIVFIFVFEDKEQRELIEKKLQNRKFEEDEKEIIIIFCTKSQDINRQKNDVTLFRK